jgi:hypothetical protein
LADGRERAEKARKLAAGGHHLLSLE